MSDLTLSIAQAANGVRLAAQYENRDRRSGPAIVASRVIAVDALQNAAFEALVRALIAKGVFTRVEAQEFMRLSLNDALDEREIRHGRQFR